jgi:hypothetical protein
MVIAQLEGIATAISPAAFVSFAQRFPQNVPTRAALTFERLLLFGLSPILVIWNTLNLFAFVFGGIAFPQWIQTTATTLADLTFAAGIAILIARYLNARNAERSRLQWVVAAFAVAYLPFLAFWWLRPRVVVQDWPALINICVAWEVLAPIALAYTVLKHRLFDIRLVISRALMYAVMMSLTVGALALVDWGFARLLEASRVALAAELGLAVLIGVLITMAHRRIERFLNGVVFRAQTLALQALRRFAQETDLIADPQRLLAQTHEALRTRLECEYAAIYTADGSSFVLAAANGGATPPLLAGDDLAVLRLRRWIEPFECDEPIHPLHGSLLVPMTARMNLVGFIVCGPKRDRTHYLPDEVDTLSTVAHRTGSAYAWLTMATPITLTR